MEVIRQPRARQRQSCRLSSLQRCYVLCTFTRNMRSTSHYICGYYWFSTRSAPRGRVSKVMLATPINCLPYTRWHDFNMLRLGVVLFQQRVVGAFVIEDFKEDLYNQHLSRSGHFFPSPPLDTSDMLSVISVPRHL